MGTGPAIPISPQQVSSASIIKPILPSRPLKPISRHVPVADEPLVVRPPTPYQAVGPGFKASSPAKRLSLRELNKAVQEYRWQVNVFKTAASDSSKAAADLYRQVADLPSAHPQAISLLKQASEYQNKAYQFIQQARLAQGKAAQLKTVGDIRRLGDMLGPIVQKAQQAQ